MVVLKKFTHLRQGYGRARKIYMSYNDDELIEEQSFKTDDDMDEPLEPLEGANNDFRFDEEADEDPDDKYH